MFFTNILQLPGVSDAQIGPQQAFEHNMLCYHKADVANT